MTRAGFEPTVDHPQTDARELPALLVEVLAAGSLVGLEPQPDAVGIEAVFQGGVIEVDVPAVGERHGPVRGSGAVPQGRRQTADRIFGHAVIERVERPAEVGAWRGAGGHCLCLRLRLCLWLRLRLWLRVTASIHLDLAPARQRRRTGGVHRDIVKDPHVVQLTFEVGPVQHPAALARLAQRHPVRQRGQERQPALGLAHGFPVEVQAEGPAVVNHDGVVPLAVGERAPLQPRPLVVVLDRRPQPPVPGELQREPALGSGPVQQRLAVAVGVVGTEA